MLTYDDLDHFDERTMSGLFGLPNPDDQANVHKRRERILACLRFCRDVTVEDLPEGGLHTARRLLRRALRSQQRDPRMRSEVIEEFLGDALQALGDASQPDAEPAEAAALRYSVEREIEANALLRAGNESVAPQVLETLARGDFRIGTGSRLAALDDALGKFNGSAVVELELVLDGGPACARARLAVACGLWRWAAQEGCSLALDGDETLPLPAGDALASVLLAGLAVQSGRAITLWARAVQASPGMRLN